MVTRALRQGVQARNDITPAWVDLVSGTISIQVMGRCSQKLVATLLALLVALLPLQGAVASVVASSGVGQGATSHQEPWHAQSGPGMLDVTQMTHTCECCVSNNCGLNSICSSVQCASCVPAILSLSNFPGISGGLIPSTKSQRPARSSPSSLFRPPRV